MNAIYILFVPHLTYSKGGLGTSGFGESDFYDEGDQCLETYNFDFAYNYINLDYLQSLNKLESRRKEFVLERLKISK